MSKVEDGRTAIKWRRKQPVKNDEDQIEAEEIRMVTETGTSVDTETELLILEYQMKADPNIKTLNLLQFWGGEDWRDEKVHPAFSGR